MKRNAYFAHSENILLEGLSAPDQKNRGDAISKTLQAKRTGLLQHEFILPDKIDWDAANYLEVIEWLPEKISVPPILQFWSEEQIKEGFEGPLQIPEYPCHNQSVERGVRLVSEASGQVYGYKERQGYILNTLASKYSPS